MNERVPYGKMMMRRMGKVCGHGNWLYLRTIILKCKTWIEGQNETTYNRRIYERNNFVGTFLYLFLQIIEHL